jgi:PAP2 superfamily
MERDREWLVPAVAIAVTAMVLAVLLKFATGFPGHPSGIASLEATIGIVTVTALLRFLGHLYRMWRCGEAEPLARLRAELKPALLSYVPIVVGVVIIGAFLYAVTYLKSMITTVVPFWSDGLFAAMDRALFIDPQGMALALAPALPAIGLFYGLWHAVHLGGILWVLHWRDHDKARHVLSFMLNWSIGMSLAYLFSSAGPLFTGTYDPAIAPASVRMAADFLWANYKAHGALIGGGISAFPSMHVALAAWFALVLKDRGFPRLGLAYLAAIFFCSIVLGWHYAADGAAGIGIALLADRLSGLWMRRASSQHGMATATATGASTA